jgi:hypothetical protein
MRSLWTTGRVIWVTLSVLLIAYGIKCLFDGQRLQRGFKEWQTATPVNGPIDLSEPGRFVLPFDQTCSSSHSETVTIRVPSETLRATIVTELFAGLNARLEIIDKAGSNLVESAHSEIIAGEERLDGAIPIFRISSFKKGSYQAIVTVVNGASSLNGIPQRLEARYLLCGLERLPATIAGIMGIGCIGIGSIGSITICLLLARDRRRRSLGQPNGGPAMPDDNAGGTAGPPSAS